MNAFVLKIVAMLTMLADHIGVVFMGDAISMRIVGRIAFPLYGFMVVDGCRHVMKKENRIKRYLIFLGILAVVSEPFYDFAFEGLWLDRTGQNQILQFFTFATAYLLSSKTDKTPVKLLIWLVTLAVNFIFHIGFWSAGIILMLMFSWYLSRYKEKPLVWRFFAMTCILALFIAAECADDALDAAGLVSFFPVFAAGLAGAAKYYGVFLALPFLALYNGSYGNPPAWFRVLYRYFYPAHLMLLSIAQFMV